MDCYEKVLGLGDGRDGGEEEGEKRKSKPMPRIDHFEFPSSSAVEKIKHLSVALTVQPGFSWWDKSLSEEL